MTPRPLLTARWESLVLLNWPCPSGLLEPLAPAGTELDPFSGLHWISLVGFRFLDTRVFGVPAVGHASFEEVNLRFYVRREVQGEVRRGVVFVRELVRRPLIAWGARLLYNEPYRVVEMSHRVTLAAEAGGMARYAWRHGGAESWVAGSVEGPALPLEPGSEAEFITEHYWGYTPQRDGGTIEYRVTHPSWRVWACDQAEHVGPGDEALYGAAFAEILREPPRSSFVAVGSEVEVYRGARVVGSPG